MKLNIQSVHTPGLLIAANLVQFVSSIADARSLVTAAYSHAREIATAEANHEAADFCGDPYAHNCGRPHCRPSDSYSGPQPPLVRRFFEVDAIAEAAPPAAGVPEGYVLAPIKPTIEMVAAGYEASLGQPDRSAHARVIEQYDAMLAEAPTPPASEQQQTVPRHKFEGLVEEVRLKDAEIARLAEQVMNLQAYRDGESGGGVWHWQGDGEDHLESLTCPIVIRAQDLRRLVASEQQRAVVMEELLTRVADWCDQQSKHDWYGRTAGDMVRAFMARQPTPAQENDR